MIRARLAHVRRASFPAGVLLIFAAAAAGQTQANFAPIEIRLDPSTTTIRWTLGATAHSVHGSFRLKNGAVRVDPATGQASGLIVIDATSGESGEKGRDRRMHHDVLESDKYPEITFRPNRVSRPSGTADFTAPGPVAIDGVLTLHGQEHALHLTGELRGGSAHLTATTSFDIPYVAWGMKDPSTFILRVEKQVHVTVESEAALSR